MTDFSPTYSRALASLMLLGGETQAHRDEIARFLVAYADASEGGLSLVDFAREGQPPRTGRVVPFRPYGKIPMPPRGRGAFEDDGSVA